MYLQLFWLTVCRQDISFLTKKTFKTLWNTNYRTAWNTNSKVLYKLHNWNVFTNYKFRLIKNALFTFTIEWFYNCSDSLFCAIQDISLFDELNLQKTSKQSTEQLKILNKILNYSWKPNFTKFTKTWSIHWHICIFIP